MPEPQDRRRRGTRAVVETAVELARDKTRTWAELAAAAATGRYPAPERAAPPEEQG